MNIPVKLKKSIKGRPRIEIDIDLAIKYLNGGYNLSSVAEEMGIAKSTLCLKVKQYKEIHKS